ncbi:MAG: hypothetical protein HRT93_10850 [Piscirickettsiaceae bacterium]|nr:hypothetical protein [Piscirickettsiaceae bacterium]
MSEDILNDDGSLGRPEMNMETMQEELAKHRDQGIEILELKNAVDKLRSVAIYVTEKPEVRHQLSTDILKSFQQILADTNRLA